MKPPRSGGLQSPHENPAPKNFKAAALALALALAGCASQPAVVSKVTAGVDLTHYRTFTIESGPGDPANPLKAEINRAVVEDLSAELLARGLVADKTNPALSFTYSTERRTGRVRFADREGLFGGDERDFQEGALVINAMDTVTNKLVWTTHAQAVIDPKDHAHRQLKIAIEKALKGYPRL